MLIDAGCNINILSNVKQTPIFIAIVNCYIYGVQKLLDCNCKIHVIDLHDESVLDKAALCMKYRDPIHKQIFEMVLQRSTECIVY